MISVKCAIQTGSLFGTDEENFSGFATLDLFLLLLLFSVLFVSFSLGCSEQKTDRGGEIEHNKHTTHKHLAFSASERTNERRQISGAFASSRFQSTLSMEHAS